MSTTIWPAAQKKILRILHLLSEVLYPINVGHYQDKSQKNKKIKGKQTIVDKRNLMLHSNIHPSGSPESVI